jgi:hypothetical protein
MLIIRHFNTTAQQFLHAFGLDDRTSPPSESLVAACMANSQFYGLGGSCYHRLLDYADLALLRSAD